MDGSKSRVPGRLAVPDSRVAPIAMSMRDEVQYRHADLGPTRYWLEAKWRIGRQHGRVKRRAAPDVCATVT